MKESRADFDRRMKKSQLDFDLRMKKSQIEFEQKVKENDRQIKESRDNYDRRQAAYERRQADYERQRVDYERRMKKFEETMGAWSNNHGSFAEEYFYNSFEAGKRNFFGEKFDEIEKNVKGFTNKDFRDEYDILLINGKTIGIIEVKFKAHENNIPKVLRKAETFRVNFPQYQHHQIYLGLATMAFHPELEQACISQGIAVIKQVGDTVVINDACLKAF